jgi:hypothetical protein
MSDNEKDYQKEEGEEEKLDEQEAEELVENKEEVKPKPKPIPLLVQYMNTNAPISKIVKLLQESFEAYNEDSEAPQIEENTAAEEEVSFEELQKQENEKVYSLAQLSNMSDLKGRNLFQWAVDNDHFLLVERLVNFGLRVTGLTQTGDSNIEQEMEIYEKWKNERERIETEIYEKLKSKESGEEEEEEEDNEEPEPDFAQTTAEELDIPVQRVRRIGDLGVYKGTYNEEGLKHGYGVCLYPNGDVYIGQYDNGRKQGKGAYIYKVKKNSIKAFYCGEWNNNMKEGKGYMLYPNGNRYMGYWKNNLMHGKAKVTYINGDSYIGEFKNGVKSGAGEYTFAKDRSKYIGDFDQGIFSSGIWKGNGFVYKGPFSNGVPSSISDQVGAIEFTKASVIQRGYFDSEHVFQVVGNLQDLVK